MSETAVNELAAALLDAVKSGQAVLPVAIQERLAYDYLAAKIACLVGAVLVTAGLWVGLMSLARRIDEHARILGTVLMVLGVTVVAVAGSQMAEIAYAPHAYALDYVMRLAR